MCVKLQLSPKNFNFKKKYHQIEKCDNGQATLNIYSGRILSVFHTHGHTHVCTYIHKYDSGFLRVDLNSYLSVFVNL